MTVVVTAAAAGENRELLYAPPTPTEELGHKLEAALLYQNGGKVKLAVETYLAARSQWLELVDAEDELPLVDIYFMCALGSVYESEEQDRVALLQFQDARQLAEELPPGHPVRALTWSFVGGVYTHMGEFRLALETFRKARAIRLITMPEDHVDVALLDNNIAVCLDSMGRSKEALAMFKAARDVFAAQLGPEHPRHYTASRNAVKCHHRIFSDFQPVVPDVAASAVYDPTATKKKRRKKKTEGATNQRRR